MTAIERLRKLFDAREINAGVPGKWELDGAWVMGESDAVAECQFEEDARLIVATVNALPVLLAAYAFTVAYEAWNETDCGEHENDDDVGCAACQQEEPLRLAKGAAYDDWRKARAETNGGDDE